MLKVSTNSVHVLTKLTQRTQSQYVRFITGTSNSGEKESFSCMSLKSVAPCKAFIGSNVPQPPDPQMCCGSGCLNCVWIEYGIQRAFYFSDQPIQNTLKEIDENVTDDYLKDYIKKEIRTRTKK